MAVETPLAEVDRKLERVEGGADVGEAREIGTTAETTSVLSLDNFIEQ